MGMIGKCIDSAEKRRAANSLAYITDEKSAAPGDEVGAKVHSYGIMNCFADNLRGAKAEIVADDEAYSGPGAPVAHWMFSWRAGERPTNAQINKFCRNFLRDQGMGDHKAIWVAHDNTENFHIHLTVLRVKPEPEPGTMKYKVQNYGAREKWDNGTNNEIMSSRATIIDFCKEEGFTPEFEEVHTPRDADAVKLNDKDNAAQAQDGKKSAKKLMGEAGRDAIRAAVQKADASFDDLRAGFARAGLGLAVKEDGTGASILGPKGERVPLSCLPEDCRLKVLQERFGKVESFDAPKGVDTSGFYQGKLTVAKAKSIARKEISAAVSMEDINTRLAAKGMSIETYGKSGAYLRYGPGDDDKMKLSALGSKYSLSALNKKFNANSSPYASNMHEKQETVNALSRKDASTHASERAEHAHDRAEAASERASDIAPSGGGEGVGDGFYDLDFIEQIRVMMSVAASQTAAHVSIMRALSQAREAEQRALEAEARAQAAGMAMETRQQPEITHKHEGEDMFDNFKKAEPKYTFRQMQDVSEFYYRAGGELDKGDFAKAGEFFAKMDATVSGHDQQQFAVKGSTSRDDIDALWDAAGSLYAMCHWAENDATGNSAPELDNNLDKTALSKIPGAYAKFRAAAAQVYEITPITIDKPNGEKSGAAVGKAPTETGLRTEKPAQVASEQEKPARRKFSFGGMVGGKFGGGKGSAPATGPKA